MASIGTIYTFQGHAYGNRPRIVASIAGLNLTLSPIVLRETNRTPEYLAKFPHGKVPAFEGPDGFLLTESTAIAKYVATLAPNSGLLGSSPKEAALIEQWISFVDTELDPSRKFLNGLLSGNAVPYNKPAEVFFRGKIEAAFATLESHLLKNTYLVGHRLSLADIIYATSATPIFTKTFGAAERKKFPNSFRLFETVINQPKVKAVVGDIQLAEKAQAFVPPPKEKKESKPAQVVAAIKEKIAPKKEKAPEPEEEDDEPTHEEPKAKNPLDLLPKPKLNLEDWKRAYSNKDTRGAGGSLEWFYENNDPEGYSLWKVAYKYPDELTQVFMSSNLIGGYFNRLEASRKYLFGSMGVLGENNNSVIEGALIARGQDIIPVVNVAPDFESYEYTRLDLNKPEDKAFFEAALAWDLEVGGKKWADGKNFK